MLRTLTATAVLTVALALPSGVLAMNGPLGGTNGAGNRPVNLLRDGKYLPTPTAATNSAQVVRVVSPRGFDYRDAGIGAAVAVLVLVGSAIVLLRGSDAQRATGTTVG